MDQKHDCFTQYILPLQFQIIEQVVSHVSLFTGYRLNLNELHQVFVTRYFNWVSSGQLLQFENSYLELQILTILGPRKDNTTDPRV